MRDGSNFFADLQTIIRSYGLTKNDRIWRGIAHMVDKRISRAQPRQHPKKAGPSVPNFFGIPYLRRPAATKSGTITHVGDIACF